MSDSPTSMNVAELDSLVHHAYHEATVDLPFHGWHHVEFVRHHSLHFARELGADERIVECAALVHDLNYLVDVRSRAEGGSEMALDLLGRSGISNAAASRIVDVVLNAETASRGDERDPNVMALSDGDTLFKALPFTPVLLSPLYMRETETTIWELAEKIVGEQEPLIAQELYFYSESANRRYLRWAQVNLDLWKNILSSRDEPLVQKIYDDLREGSARED